MSLRLNCRALKVHNSLNSFINSKKYVLRTAIRKVLWGDQAIEQWTKKAIPAIRQLYSSAGRGRGYTE